MKGILGIVGVVVLGIALTSYTGTAKAQAPESTPVDVPQLEPAPSPVHLQPAPGSAPTPLSNEAPGKQPDTSTTRQEPAVSLEWIGPTKIKVGRPVDYTVAVRNVCPTAVQQVLVRVQLPEGTRVTATQPKANIEGNVLWWDLDTLEAKQEKNLQVQLVPDGRGNLSCHAWVTFTGTTAMKLNVTEPKLAVKLTGPEKAVLGESTFVMITVSNPGDGPAEQVRIHASLTDGLEHPAGQSLVFDVGNLASKESKSIRLNFGCKAGGEQICETIVDAKGDLRAKDRVCVNVATPHLDLEVLGPKLRYLDRKAVYTFKVVNSSEAPANDVVITDVIPAGFKFRTASDGGQADAQSQTVSWNLGDLGPSAAREVKLEVVAVNPGEHHHKVCVQAARGLKVDSDILTQVKGLSTLIMEVINTDRSVEVGAETCYEIRITNTGSKEETDIKLVGLIPEQMEFKSARGPTRFEEKGKEIHFEALPALAPRADAVYRINVKALKPGDVRFKAQFNSTHIVEPVTEMETTRIYED
jgi:uncharacterized repeat protein (TIGR01451 family)